MALLRDAGVRARGRWLPERLTHEIRVGRKLVARLMRQFGLRGAEILMRSADAAEPRLR